MLAFLFWTLLALSYALSMVLSAKNEGEALSWHRALAWNLPIFYIWMLLTPLVVRLERLTAGCGWLRFWALHLPSSIVIAALQTTVMLLVYWKLRGSGSEAAISFGKLFRNEFIYTFHLGLLIY